MKTMKTSWRVVISQSDSNSSWILNEGHKLSARNLAPMKTKLLVGYCQDMKNLYAFTNESGSQHHDGSCDSNNSWLMDEDFMISAKNLAPNERSSMEIRSLRPWNLERSDWLSRSADSRYNCITFRKWMKNRLSACHEPHRTSWAMNKKSVLRLGCFGILPW